MTNKLTALAHTIVSMTEEEAQKFAAAVKGDVEHIVEWAEGHTKENPVTEGAKDGEEGTEENKGEEADTGTEAKAGDTATEAGQQSGEKTSS